MATQMLTVNGIRLNVVDEGEGDPILFLHGFPDSSYLWRHQIAFLSERGFRCIAPDLRGFGDSDKPVGVEHYGLMTVVADLVALLDQLGIERTHVVGHDWGAATAWLFAIFQSVRVDQLVALSVGRPGLRRRTARELRNLWYMFMFNTPEAEEAITRDDWSLFRDSFKHSPDFERSLSDLAKPGALTAGLSWYRANIAPAILLGDPIDFPRVTVPTMGIWSSLDFALSEEQMTGSAAVVDADWRYERIDGVSHWIPTEAPERLNDLLLERFKA